jgi:hypothetical protein
VKVQVLWYNENMEIVKQSSTGGSMKTKQWHLPVSTENESIFEQMAQLFTDSYEIIIDFYHGKKASEKVMLRLQERYMAIIKEYQEDMFAQPVPEEVQ